MREGERKQKDIQNGTELKRTPSQTRTHAHAHAHIHGERGRDNDFFATARPPHTQAYWRGQQRGSVSKPRELGTRRRAERHRGQRHCLCQCWMQTWLMDRCTEVQSEWPHPTRRKNIRAGMKKRHTHAHTSGTQEHRPNRWGYESGGATVIDCSRSRLWGREGEGVHLRPT